MPTKSPAWWGSPLFPQHWAVERHNRGKMKVRHFFKICSWNKAKLLWGTLCRNNSFSGVMWHENYMALPLLWSMGSKQGARERPIINLSGTLSHNRMPDKYAERQYEWECRGLMQFTTDDWKTSLRVKRVSLKSFITRIVLSHPWKCPSHPESSEQQQAVE